MRTPHSWWLTSNFQRTGLVMEPMDITDCLGIKENCSGSSSIRLTSCVTFANWFGCHYDTLVWHHLEPCMEWPEFNQNRTVCQNPHLQIHYISGKAERKEEGGRRWGHGGYGHWKPDILWYHTTIPHCRRGSGLNWVDRYSRYIIKLNIFFLSGPAECCIRLASAVVLPHSERMGMRWITMNLICLPPRHPD